jgi:Taurine catabolism dioxygenase TauD, TfdA family
MTPAAVPLPPFEAFVVTDSQDQRTLEGVQAPFVVSPPPGALTVLSSPDVAAEFVRRNRAQIDRALDETGAVLFRGFPLGSADDFDVFVKAFDGFNDLSYERSMSFAVRKRVSDRICTTNEGKSGGLVFHHEQAQTPLWPSHVFFCCLLPAQPGDGGATGLCSSELVYKRLQEKHPDFCRQCERDGVRYTIYAGPEQDTSKGAGRSWKSFFHCSTRDECEAKMSGGGWTWEWGVGPNGARLAGDFLKCTTPLLEAVREVAPSSADGTSGVGTKKCFFNQLIATTANALEFSKVGVHGGGYDPLRDVPTQEAIDSCVRFGNGDSVPLGVLLDAKQLCEDLAIDVQWKRGDVALISNYLMMHARRPWNGPEGSRVLLASLVAEENCTSFGQSLVAL